MSVTPALYTRKPTRNIMDNRPIQSKPDSFEFLATVGPSKRLTWKLWSSRDKTWQQSSFPAQFYPEVGITSLPVRNTGRWCSTDLWASCKTRNPVLWHQADLFVPENDFLTFLNSKKWNRNTIYSVMKIRVIMNKIWLNVGHNNYFT